MAVNQSRSMNAELIEGATDGSYRKIIAERSAAEHTSAPDRLDLSSIYYGIREKRDKVVPGVGGAHATTAYVENPAFTGYTQG